MKKTYTGLELQTQTQCKPYEIDPYLPSAKLTEAVGLAQILQRPLLVKGEPGCGKSRLAQAVAAELHGANFREHYFEWNVKSSSKAQDGLYTIDHLKRLSDANIRREAGEEDGRRLEITLQKDADGQYLAAGNYINLNELGQAFVDSHRSGLENPPVVLIDEIDKADIDFPNDLLIELERMAFKIPEIKDENGKPVIVSANQQLRPIFIITSNDEKPLPAAFLRRCLFYYIDFKEIKLQQIVESKFPALKAHQQVVADAVAKFTEWREKIAQKGISTKNISTSELLDWVTLIDHFSEEGAAPVFEDQNGMLYQSTLLKDLESIQLFAKNSLSSEK